MGGKRGMILGCAVVCYAAALVIGAAAARLPQPPTLEDTRDLVVRTSGIPHPSPLNTPLSTAYGTPPVADQAKAAATRSIVTSPPPVASSWEQELFSLAQQQRRAGDLKGAEASYQRLYRQGSRRDEAARKLGEIYVRTGAYGQAEEMYRESARLLRERQN